MHVHFLSLKFTAKIVLKSEGKELQRALWTDPPKVRIMPGVPRWEENWFSVLQNPSFFVCRKLDYQGRQKIRKDCDEVFPQIMVGTGDCIKDVSFWPFCKHSWAERHRAYLAAFWLVIDRRVIALSWARPANSIYTYVLWTCQNCFVKSITLLSVPKSD